MKVTGTFNGIWPRVQKWFWSRTKKKWHSIGPAQLMRGFAGFQVLVSGCQLGLFAVLSRKPNRTAQEISTELKLPQHSANALLLSCTSLGLIKRNKRRGTYRLTWLMERFWEDERRARMLPCLEAFHRLMYQPFYFLTDALRQGTNVGMRYFPGNGNTLYERLESHLEEKRVFHAWMAAMGTGKDRIPRAVIAALRDVDHLLDVGGGDANNAIDLVRQLENLSVTIFDLPLACDMAATNIEQAGLSNRIFTVAGNFLEDPFPTNVDAVMFAHIFNIYSAETNQSVIQKCSDMLKAGGKVVLFNLVSANDQSGPWHAAFLSLYFQVLATGDGFVYPTTCYEAWFRNAGFDSLVVHVDPRSGEGIFVGTK